MALEMLSDADATKRLHDGRLGRIALCDRQSKPQIFPVNYFFDEGVIAFRTAPGTKLDLARGSYAVFEIDGWNEETGEGWSVIAKGVAHDFTHPRMAPASRIHYWPVTPAAPGMKLNWIGIVVTEITGRRFGPSPEATPGS
ncbi:MAG TPA: pyridoxamine 5'-phosphate oxidase family protein [Candidatus Dormibacteraeota bacterium]|nr:pyridoxamine 5'-phosphate oxidase family protein [Candidatus Dormibacteraeota bacterium]